MSRVLVTLQLKRTASNAQDEGATAVEYGLLVELIAAVIVTTVALLGRQINTAFNTVPTAITSA